MRLNRDEKYLLQICDDCNNDLNTKINSIDKMHRLDIKLMMNILYDSKVWIIKHEKDGDKVLSY